MTLILARIVAILTIIPSLKQVWPKKMGWIRFLIKQINHDNKVATGWFLA